jgi:hypothetical protein
MEGKFCLPEVYLSWWIDPVDMTATTNLVLVALQLKSLTNECNLQLHKSVH